MKKIDRAQLINTLANLGVIAGIVFLAFELHQNSEELAAQSRNSLYSMQTDVQRDIFNNVGGVADLMAKARQGEQLTDVEQTRVSIRLAYLLRTFKYMYREDPKGALDSASWISALFTNQPELGTMWCNSRDSEDPDYVRFIENSVSGLCDP